MGWYEERFQERAGRHRFDCIQCGRGMWFPACKLGKYKTCGPECAETVRSAAKGRRTRPCATCGALFTPRATQLARGVGLFCSQACNTAGREALSRPDAKSKAAQAKRAMFASGELIGLRGDKNPNWNGGKELARARQRVSVGEYKKANPDRVRVWSATRRKKGGASLPVVKVRELFAKQRGCCAVCRGKLPKGYHLDHIEPIAKGGGNEPTNFQLLCPLCNAHKGAKEPTAFMQSRGFLL